MIASQLFVDAEVHLSTMAIGPLIRAVFGRHNIMNDIACLNHMNNPDTPLLIQFL